MEITITLPIPQSNLSPNNRTHWRGKIGTKNTQKTTAYSMALKHKGKYKTGNIEADITFHAATNHPYDLDNKLAALKSAIDGIALGMGFNDTAINPIIIRRGPPDKGNPRTVVILRFD